MSETIVLYALKCEAGYVKTEEDGYRIVDMQKASVFKDVESTLSAKDSLPASLGVYAVELTITERNLLQ